MAHECKVVLICGAIAAFEVCYWLGAVVVIRKFNRWAMKKMGGKHGA